MTSGVVTGQIIVPPDTRIPNETVAYVRLLDTTIADASAIEVATVVIKQVGKLIRSNKPVAFEFAAIQPQPRIRYTVAVHIDVDADGYISVGDYVSAQSYPVLTYGYPRHVQIKVKHVSS